MMKKNIILLISISSLISCEGYLDGSGKVKSQVTKKPLDSVLVKAYIRKKTTNNFVRQIYTDTSGVFMIGSGLVGCVPSCPDFILEFSKKGYKTKDVTDPRNVDVFLEKE